MRAGARGYVLKEAEPEALKRAIEAAYRGEVILCHIIARKLLQHFRNELEVRPGLPYERITQREPQVLQLAAEGLSNKAIAKNLLISEKTVKNHITNIFSKLNANDRTQAILQALGHGLVSMPRVDTTQDTP